MNTDKWQRLNDALTVLFSPGLDLANYASRACQVTHRLLACELCCFGSLDVLSGKLEIFFDALGEDEDPPHESLEVFVTHIFKDPAFRIAPFLAEGKPFLRSDLSSARFRLRHDRFYGAGLGDCATIPVPTAENTVLFVAVQRAEGGRFSEADRQILEALQLHLANARSLAVAKFSAEPTNIDAATFIRHGLTPRESEVLRWLVQGKSNVEIASILLLRPQTVKGYVTSIFDKLGVGNRHAALLRALELASYRDVVRQSPRPPCSPARLAITFPDERPASAGLVEV